MGKRNYRIVELIDPKPIKIWPSYVKEKCKITNKTNNTFYRSENDIKNIDHS